MYMYVSKQTLGYKVTQRGVSRSSLKLKKKNYFSHKPFLSKEKSYSSPFSFKV